MSFMRIDVGLHRPRKRFGQHFLTDQGVIAQLVSAIHPQISVSPTKYIEIGPGLGALTAPLLAQMGGQVLDVIELDRDLARYLPSHFGKQIILHEGDVLKFDFKTLIPMTPSPESQFLQAIAPARSLRIVGNLPYNISTPLLFHLCNYADYVIDQHFMLQSEVVDRMVASPGSKAYGRLSVMLQYRYTMEKCFDIPPEAFTPPPKVQSAVVRMIPRPHDLSDAQTKALEDFVRIAFSQRRKILRNTLGVQYAHIDFNALKFDLCRRAEEVGVEEYVRVVKTFC